MPLNGLANIITRLQTFDFEQATKDVILENAEIIIYLLQRQLTSGLDGNENAITVIRKGSIYDFYSRDTEREREEKGLQTDVIDLNFTGEFYSSMYIKVEGNVFSILSEVPYFKKIISRSGKSVMKLTEESLKILTEEVIKPQVQEKYNLFLNAR